MNERNGTQNTASTAPAPQVVESASASTACQTNDSNFAYYLTAGILGGCLLFVIAIAMLVLTLLQAGVSNGAQIVSFSTVAHRECVVHRSI